MLVRYAAPAFLFAIFIGSSFAQPANPDPTIQANRHHSGKFVR